MSKYGDPNTVTGKAFVKPAKPTVATDTLFPLVDKVALTNIDSAINDTQLSGKQKGAMVMFEDGSVLSLAVATGSLPGSPWEVMRLTDTYTPVAP